MYLDSGAGLRSLPRLGAIVFYLVTHGVVMSDDGMDMAMLKRIAIHVCGGDVGSCVGLGVGEDIHGWMRCGVAGDVIGDAMMSDGSAVS